MTETLPQPEQQGTDFKKLLNRCFWLCLFVAAGLFAAVYFAPSYSSYIKLKVARYDNQVKLVTLERYVQYLGTVSDAQSNNTSSNEMNDADLAPLSEVIDEGFQLDPQMLKPIQKIPKATLPSYMHHVELLATSVQTRRSVMAAAAFLLVFAFVFFQDSSVPRLQAATATISNCIRWVTYRYSNHEEIEEDESEENEVEEGDLAA